MTEHNLTEGDVLYHRIYDRKLTIESVDTETVVFDDDGYQYDRSILELAIEVGDYDHRPVRADGGEEETDHNLQPGDVLWDNRHSTMLTIADRDGQRVRLEGRYINESTIKRIEKRIVDGRFDHRPVRADGDDELECVHCGANEEPEHGITIQLVDELNEPVCSICLEETGNKSVYGGP